MPPTNESSPLLGHQNGSSHETPHTVLGRLKVFVKAEGQPGWLKSFRWFIFGSWLNLFLIFIPLSFISHFLDLDAALRFTFSFLAIVPLAKVCVLYAPSGTTSHSSLVQLLGDATEQMSLSMGQTIAGLLNASFGNAVEIIVGVTALLHGASSLFRP